MDEFLLFTALLIASVKALLEVIPELEELLLPQLEELLPPQLLLAEDVKLFLAVVHLLVTLDILLPVLLPVLLLELQEELPPELLLIDEVNLLAALLQLEIHFDALVFAQDLPVDELELLFQIDAVQALLAAFERLVVLLKLLPLEEELKELLEELDALELMLELLLHLDELNDFPFAIIKLY